MYHQIKLRSTRAEHSGDSTISPSPKCSLWATCLRPREGTVVRQGQILPWSGAGSTGLSLCYLTLQKFQGELLGVQWEDGDQKLLFPFSITFLAFGNAP